MILANVAAAETLERASVPLIYRVHDEPVLEKRRTRCANSSQTLDISLPKAGALRAAQFNRILRAGEGHARTRSWSTRWCCARRRRPNTPPRTTAISA